MTNKQPDAQFDWATELLDAQEHVTLSAKEAHEIGARLRRQHARIAELEAQLEAIGASAGSEPEALHHTKYLTVVYRDIKPGDEARELIMHPKMTASSWSHVMNERDRLQDENANLNAGSAAARLKIEVLRVRVQELEQEAQSLRKDAERFRFANESEEDFAICYWDEEMGNGGEWMCHGSKGDSIEVLDAAIRARGAQGDAP